MTLKFKEKPKKHRFSRLIKQKGPIHISAQIFRKWSFQPRKFDIFHFILGEILYPWLNSLPTQFEKPQNLKVSNSHSTKFSNFPSLIQSRKSNREPINTKMNKQRGTSQGFLPETSIWKAGESGSQHHHSPPYIYWPIQGEKDP